MANIFLFTTTVIVVSTSVNSERRSFLNNLQNFHQAVPHQLKHDQEELNRNVDKNSGQSWRGVRVGPRPPPLWPSMHDASPLTNHVADKDVAQSRVQQLKNKLILNNNIHIRAINQPHSKPNIDLKSQENKKLKREIKQSENEFRTKREVMINRQINPEIVMQPYIQPAPLQEAETKGIQPKLNFHFYNPSIYYPEVIDALSNNTGHYQDKIIDKRDKGDKRDKRQILLMINKQPLRLAKRPRTTINPFDPETNIADYDIVKPDAYKPEVEVLNPMDTDSYQLREPQSLFQYLRSMIFKIGQKLSNELIPISKTNTVNEETHIRVKRRMSKFRRDRKQITRKKKIGRQKKMKVRRAPVKFKKWYEKRSKKKKKGDGTYRGGRGRIPRQHKRPRNYKQPQNETSDYDYYDEDGNIKEPSGETQEGSDDAAYVTYGTGEYADTAEARAAHQELEREYQMQLVRERKRAERKRLSNGTWDSTEEIPFVKIEKQVSTTTKRPKEETSGQEEDSDEDSNSSGGEGKINKDKRAKTRNNDVNKRKNKQSNGKQASDKVNNLKASDHLQNKYYNKQAPENKSNEGKVNVQVNTDQRIDSISKSNAHDIRLTAKKFNVMSQSAFPLYRNSLQQNRPSNWMTAVNFGVPQNKMFKNLQSVPFKKIPDVNSISNPIVALTGGKNLQTLQSKKLHSVLESTSHDKNLGLTSAVKDKSENAQTFNSKSNDEKKKLTSIGNERLKLFQSIAHDPLTLTSIARHVPNIEPHLDILEEKDPNMIQTKNDKTDLKKATDNDSRLNGKKILNNKAYSKGSVKNYESKKYESNPTKNRIRNQKLHLQKSESYEELGSVPDKSLGNSVASSELESAPDD